MVGLSSDYYDDGRLVVGKHPKDKEYAHLYRALESLGITYEEEKVHDKFFADVKGVVVGEKRIWFDVVYGTA